MESVLMGNMGATETFSPTKDGMVEYIQANTTSGKDIAIELPVPTTQIVPPSTKVIVEAPKSSTSMIGRYLPYALGAGVLYYLLFMRKK
jgi:hypothetical protein